MAGIALMLIPEDAVGDEHLTLGFFGDTGAAVQGMKPYVELGLKLIAFEFAPTGKVNGVGIFNLPDGYASVQLVDSIEVEYLRAKLQRVLQGDGNILAPVNTPLKSEHGFIPHMTMAIFSGEEYPGVAPIEGRDLKFDRLRVGFGDKYTDLWFEGFNPNVQHAIRR